MGTEQLAVLRLETQPGIKSNIVQSHKHPVVAVRYSKCFNQIVTACEGAVSATIVEGPHLASRQEVEML